MSHAKKLKEIASRNNSESLLYDAISQRFIQIPNNIDTNIDSHFNQVNNDLKTRPFIKLLPQLNPEQTFQSIDEALSINTSGKNVRFISEHSFKSGVHYIEINSPYDFSNVKFILTKTSSKGTIKEYTLNLDSTKFSESVVVKIDMENKLFSLLSSKSNNECEIRIKGSCFKFVLELKQIGKFVSLNPCFLYKGENNVWSLNLRLFDSRYAVLLKNWIFFEDFDVKKHESVEKFIAEKIERVEEEIVSIGDTIFDEELKILAVKILNEKCKMVKKNLKGVECVHFSSLQNVLKFVFEGLSFNGQLQHQGLIDFITKNTLKFFEKKVHSNLLKVIGDLKNLEPNRVEKTYSVKSNTITGKYLHESDSLLLFNGINKLKLVKEKTSKGEFIVSPFIFDTDRVNFYLTKQEYHLLFDQLNWIELVDKLYFTDNELNILEESFKAMKEKDSIFFDDKYYFISLKEQYVHVLLEKAFEYLNLQINKAYPFLQQIEESSVEISPQEKTEEKTPKINQMSDVGLGDLFSEAIEKNSVSSFDKINAKMHLESIFKSPFENFPNEFDKFLRVLFKMEEALFLQSSVYRKQHLTTTRSHTAFGRLFSFISSTLTISQISRLVDFGIYINSSFLGQFKHYKYEKYFFNDFNDQNISDLFIRSYSESKLNPNCSGFTNDNVNLNYSISHLPCFFTKSKIEKYFSAQNGRFVCVITEDKQMIIFSTKFGLTKIFESNLKTNVTWTTRKTFESIIQNNTADTADLPIDQTEEVKNIEATKPIQPVSEEIAQEKLIDKNMLDNLYGMGFSIELSKQALLETKSASIEEAITQIFKIKENKNKQQEPTKSKVIHLTLKPQWDCKMCTLSNFVDLKNSTPEICQACGNMADNDAYFQEKEEEEIVVNPEVESNLIFKSDVEIGLHDEITQFDIISLKSENLLHKFFIILTIKKDDKHFLLVSRLAFSETIIKKLAFQDPKSKQFVSSMGFYQLKKSSCDKDLGELVKSFFEDKILNMFSSMHDCDIFTESNRKLIEIKMNDNFIESYCNDYSFNNERGCESKLIYLVGSEMIQILCLSNKSKEYCSNAFDLDVLESQPVGNVNRIIPNGKDKVVLLKEKSIDEYDLKLSKRINSNAIKCSSNLIHLTNEVIIIIDENSDLITYNLNQKNSQNLNKTLIEQINSFKNDEKATTGEDFVSPQALLGYFKTKSNIRFRTKQSENLIEVSNKCRFTYQIGLQTIDLEKSSHLTIIPEIENDGCNFNAELFIKVPKTNQNIVDFLNANAIINPKPKNTFSNSYQKLELKSVVFKGTALSKSHHLSQMLVNNGEYFSTKYPFNLFVFESVFERIMKVKKVNFIVAETFKQNSAIDEVLVFVFNDLMFLNQFDNFKNLSQIKFETALKNGSFSSSSEPCLHISLKNNTSGSVSEELEVGRFGRYIAFLPIKKDTFLTKGVKTLDCLQYFGVEGEFAKSSEADLFKNGYSFSEKNPNLLNPFEGFSIEFKFNEKLQKIDKMHVVSVQETKNDFIAKLIISTSIVNKSISKIDVTFSGKTNEIALISANISLSDISHFLIIKIREQFEKGTSEKLTSIFNGYNSQIIEASNKENVEIQNNYLNLIDLLLFIIEIFGEKSIDSVLKLNWEHIIAQNVLNNKESKIIGSTRFLLEKLLTFESCHLFFEKIFVNCLANLHKKKLTELGLQSFWQLFATIFGIVNEELKMDILTNVFKNLDLSTQKTKHLFTFSTKILRTFGFQETINHLPNFVDQKESVKNNAIGGKINGLDKKSLQTTGMVNNEFLVDWNGFSYHEKNYAEYYINCTEVVNLNEVLIKFPKIKPLLHLSIEVMGYNCRTENFEVIKSKKLTEDFINYIGSKEISEDASLLQFYDLGLNFGNYNEIVKLLKIVIKVNYIPVFDYTDSDSTIFQFYVFGTPVETIMNKMSTNKDEIKAVKENIIQDFTRLSNIYFTQISNDLNGLSFGKGKMREIDSKQIYSGPVEELAQIKLATERSIQTQVQDELNFNQENKNESTDDIVIFGDLLEEYIKGLQTIDLKTKNTIDSKLGVLVSQYKSALDIKKPEFFDSYDQELNLSFWITNLDLMIKDFSEILLSKTFFARVFSDKSIFTSILVRIFFDSYFFETTNANKKKEDFLIDSLKLLSAENIKEILQKIMEEYLLSNEMFFVNNIDRLIEKLKTLKLHNTIEWTETLEKIHSCCTLQAEDMIECDFRHLFSNCSLLNVQITDIQKCEQKSFDQMQELTVWMLTNKLESVSKKFEETLLSLCHQIFKSLGPDGSDHLNMNLDHLKPILLLTAKNGMLPKLDKMIAELVKSITKVQPKTINVKKYRSFLFNTKSILMSFISENILECEPKSTFGSEKISDILFFALSHIKSIDEIQFMSSQEKEEEVKNPVISTAKDQLIKKNSKIERQSSINQITLSEESAFNNFVNDILGYMCAKNIQDNALISIVTNFAINEQINSSLLFNFIKFTMAQSNDIRQTIIYDLGVKFTDIHKAKKLKIHKNKNLTRDFGSSTIELLIELMKNYESLLLEDISLTHFAISITLHIINENEAKSIVNENCKLPIKPQLITSLFYYTVNILVNRFNFGGSENFQSFLESEINLFELLCNCIHIIVKGVDESNSPLLTYFIQNFKNLKENSGDFDLNIALESLSIWSLCNYSATSPDLKSVVGPMLKKLSSDVNQLFAEFFKKEEAAKLMLNFICSNFKKLHEILSKKIQKGTLGYQAVYMSENSIEFFETILNYISKNEILANHFLTNIKGLEIIFEILHKNSSEGSINIAESDQKQSLFSQMRSIANAEKEKSKTLEILKTTLSPIKDKAMFEEEFGTKITNIQVDKAINNGATVKDWNSNKSGRNSSIFNTSIPVNRKSVSLRFKTTEDFELRTFRLSLTVARSENYLIVGPSPYVHLYAIQEDEKKEIRKVYLGELKRVMDPGYLIFNCMIYVLNINKLEGKDFVSSINNLRYLKEMREFEIVIARPLFSVVDRISPLSTRTVTAVNMSINFISIEGFSQSKIEVHSIFKNKIQTSFFKFLEIIFNSESFAKSIDDYFDTVNLEKKYKIYDLIETQLNPIMQNFEEKMSKLLMTLSEKNKKLADSIFVFLMKNIEKKPIFYFLIERILKKTFSYKYLFEFFDYGKRKLLQESGNVSRFLMVLVNYITFFVKKLESEGHEVKFILPIDEKFYKTILNAHKSSCFNYQIERFLVIIIHFLIEGKLYTNFPMQLSNIDGYLLNTSQLVQNTREVGEQFLRLIIEKIDKNEYMYMHLLAYTSLRSKEAKELIVTKNMIDIISEKIKTKNWEISLEVLLFIQSICEDESLYNSLIEKNVHKNLIILLEENLNQKYFKENVDLINTTLKTIFILHKKNEQKIIDLEKALFLMLKKHKKSSFFIEKILLKFFEFEYTKKVNFNYRKEIQIDKSVMNLEENGRITGLNKQKLINLPTNRLSENYLNHLGLQLIFLVDEKTEKMIKTFEWKKILETNDGTEDFSEKFEAQMYNKKPSLTILTLDNNGSIGYLGLFVPEGFIKYPDQTEAIAYVPNSDNTFLFWYSEETFVHFKPSLDKCDKFLKYYNSESNKSIVFTYDSSEKIILSMIGDYPSSIDLYQMKTIPQDNLPDYEFPYDCVINGIEIFQLEVKADEKSEMINESNNEYLMGHYIEKLNIVNIGESLYQESICYEIPNQIAYKTLKNMFNSVVLNTDYKEKLIGEIDQNKIIVDVLKEISPFTKTIYQNQYNPLFPLFEVFLAEGGIQYVIGSIKENDNLVFLKEKNCKETWKQLMDDLLDLQNIEGFLSSMTQNNEFLLIIFELFIDSQKSTRNWEDAEFMISNLMFDKLASILKNTDSLPTRFVFFEKNVLRKLLDKLKTLSYENERKYSETNDQENVVVNEIPFDKEEPILKEIKKRKGVGYEKEGTGKKWMVNEYLAKKKLRNEFIVNLLKLFKNLFALPLENYLPEDESINKIKDSWFRTIGESSLLPMLEGAFKCSSLHEMSKEYEVYQQYCEILETISANVYLKKLLLQLPVQYRPVQLESVISILKKQEDNTNLFKNLAQAEKIKSSENEDKSQSIELGNLILETIDKLKKCYQEQFDDDNDDEYETITEQQISEINQLSVNEQYKISFKNLRFDLINFKKQDETTYDHHYFSNISSDPKSSAQSRMVRLAQEITDLSSSLPIDSYNAITVRADANRLDVIKSMIAGAENTPYANGLFEYHIYLSSEYPTGPPKCNLETTGSGDVRFNPNLYSCGKVCLSLLGTWRGSASENWDPKISNLLQLLLSIQSVVMSEEVYFNEPGYEGEAGTEEGEKKNEGYSNIVRLCNIKYGMIKHIKTPIVGFEEVTRRHFYIKRQIILKECAKWVKYAEVRPCTYGGLITDHNHKYASKFSGNPKAYITDLKAAIIELEKTLKELVISVDPKTIFANKKLFVNKNKSKTKKKKVENVDSKLNHEKIDTTWDDFKQFEKFDADDKKVADRWSRYIGAMGIEAVKKQSTAKVVIIGLNALGLEIAKNIVLSGVNTLTLVDWKKIKTTDLLGNFYASQADIGQNRALCVKSKIQQLNFYVKVEAINLEEKDNVDFINSQTVVIITDNFSPKTSKILQCAQENKIKLIIAENIGVYSRIFVDFGNEFVVNDRDGEDPSECYIKNVDHEKNLIYLFDKSFNQLRNGDFIVFSEVDTINDETIALEMNGSIHKIKDMKRVTEIEVEDLSKLKKYHRNGKIKELKVPIKYTFKSYDQLTIDNQESFMDENLSMHDFMKLDSIPLVSKCYILKELFEKNKMKELSQSSLKEFLEILSEEQRKDDKLVKKMTTFWVTSRGNIHSLDAFIGGMVSQETIIGITGKYTPIKQLFCTDIEDILTDELKNTPDLYTEEKINEIVLSEGKYGPLSLLIGRDLLTLIKSSKLFIVGAGAIGCELLKNCTMIGIGSGESGGITLTDPDSIELSNLNRQFLFREKHISKHKSFVAASVVQTMNEDYKERITARLEKVCDETEEVFNDEFIKKQSICLNALDNIKARVYMDQRCVKNHIPLLESGTLGPKGHVQVILPGQTENYSQVRDANEEHNIPVCTLKMFPEEPIHCMEWAKDQFEVIFNQNPSSILRVLEEYNLKKDVTDVDLKIKKSVFKLFKNRPTSEKNTIELARKYYQKCFVNKIKQLLHVYPLDHKTKEGKLFWTLPKRPPVPKDFSLENEVDKRFIYSYSKLLCAIWGMEAPKLEESEIGKIISEMVFEPFKPKDSEIKKIKKDVAKMEKKEVNQEEELSETEALNALDEELKINTDLNDIIEKIDLQSSLKRIRPEVFEKDVDSNGHVDLIYSLTSLRLQNYKLSEMDWMSVKLKAGRIVPALATTTATIAALQTIEAIKIIKKNKLDEFKNCFLNLAIPTMTLSEPGPVAKFKIHDELTVNVWDQWFFSFGEKENNTLKHLLEFIESTYKLFVVDVLKDNKPIYLSAINERKVFEKAFLSDLLELELGESCFVTMICKLSAESEKALQNLPAVKISFK